jgi:hypothetical protein
MTVVFPLLLGCGLTAFGPSVALFYTVVSKRAQLVIVALSGYVSFTLSIIQLLLTCPVIKGHFSG